MEIVEGGVETQAEQCLKNMKAVLEAGGSELGKVVKTTVGGTFLSLCANTDLTRRMPT